MPSIKISAMTAASSVNDADLVPIVQSGANFKATVANLFSGRAWPGLAADYPWTGQHTFSGLPIASGSPAGLLAAFGTPLPASRCFLSVRDVTSGDNPIQLFEMDSVADATTYDDFSQIVAQIDVNNSLFASQTFEPGSVKTAVQYSTSLTPGARASFQIIVQNVGLTNLQPDTADGSTPYFFDTTITHTSGTLFDVKNNGTSAISVDYAGNLTVAGKLTATGGIDPPYLLLDRETRQSVSARVAKEVPASKAGGAALFFNSQTKRLEVYVKEEDSFYNLSGVKIE